MYNQLYNGDCLDILQIVPDKSANLILVDLPFQMIAEKWDKLIPMTDLWEHFNRMISPSGTICLFAAQPFTTYLINSNLKDFKYVWYWIKNQGTNFFHAKRMPIRKVEEIVVFKSGKYFPQISEGHLPTNSAKGSSNGKAYHGENVRDYKGGSTQRYPTNVLDFKCVDNYSRIHVSQKPVELLEYLIKTYTEEDELVLDCCMGSGSTIEAAIKTKRKYIGIEKDKNIFELAKNRIEKLIL